MLSQEGGLRTVSINLSESSVVPYDPFSFHPGRIRCAIYARYSSDNQHPSSIEDQIRNCREAADRKGWIVVEHYIFSDEEVSGTSIHGRNEFQRMMRTAKSLPRPFDYILMDDTSRFCRNKADGFKAVDILKFHRVNIYFVEDELDSSDPYFEAAYHQKAQRDQEYSKSLGRKVRRGRVGRFLAGFNPGGYCFGFKNSPVEDPTRKGDYGRPMVIAVLQEVNAEEAPIIIRIFQARLSGMSLFQIAAMLNAEGVPTCMSSRGKRKSVWCKTAIREMLRNERYIGKTVEGRTRQEKDPETGKVRVIVNPEHEWSKKDNPHLRIVSDELFYDVQKVMDERGANQKSLGGMSRTEAARKYLFSGLLKCGVCGGGMSIVSTKKNARYGCSISRNTNTCPNRRTVALESLETKFLAALSHNLRSLVTLEDLVSAVFIQVQATMRADRKSDRSSEECEARLPTVDAQIANVMAAIRDAGHNRSLITELEKLEREQDRLRADLATLRKPQTSVEVTEIDVRRFVVEALCDMEGLLKAEPARLKAELRKLITKLTLTPVTQDGRNEYLVTGDIGLFSPTEGTLQSNQGDLSALHCTFPISFSVRIRPRNKRVVAAEVA